MKFNRRWLPLNALRAFEATSQHLSFTLAAEQLGVTQSAVSRQVKSLEELLGIKLIERLPRELVLTSEGEMLVKKVTQGFDIFERTLRDIVEEGNRNIIHTSIATSFAHCRAPNLISGFTEQFPHIDLEIDATSNLVEIENSDYDLAIVFSKPRVTNQVMDLLWTEELTPLCSPQLLKEKGQQSIEEFIHNNVLLHVKTEDGRYHAWETWARHSGLNSIDTHSGLTFDASILAANYAIEGRGILIADKRLYQDDIDKGNLCMPSDQVCDSGFGYYLAMRQEDMASEDLQLFRNWVIDRCKLAND